MAKNTDNAKSPVEKLALFLDTDDFDETRASQSKLLEEVRSMGIDPADFTEQIGRMVVQALVRAEPNEAAPEARAETQDREFWLRRSAEKAAPINFDRHKPEQASHYVLLAAKSSSDGEEDAEGLTLISSLSIEDVSFQILRDAEAYAYLDGPVPEAVTHLCLGYVCYELTPAGKSTFKIEGIGLIGIQRFLAERSREPDVCTLKLVEARKVSLRC